MYEDLTDAEYWKIADQKIARLRLSEEDMEKVRAWTKRTMKISQVRT